MLVLQRLDDLVLAIALTAAALLPHGGSLRGGGGSGGGGGGGTRFGTPEINMYLRHPYVAPFPFVPIYQSGRAPLTLRLARFFWKFLTAVLQPQITV